MTDRKLVFGNDDFGSYVFRNESNDKPTGGEALKMPTNGRRGFENDQPTRGEVLIMTNQPEARF